MKKNNLTASMKNLRTLLHDYLLEHPGVPVSNILSGVMDSNYNVRYLTGRKLGFYLSNTFDGFRFEEYKRTGQRVYFVDELSYKDE